MDRSARVVLWRSVLSSLRNRCRVHGRCLKASGPATRRCGRWNRVLVSAFPASPLIGLFMSRVRFRDKPFWCKVVLVLLGLVPFNSRIKRERELSQRAVPKAIKKSRREQGQTRFCFWATIWCKESGLWLPMEFITS